MKENPTQIEFDGGIVLDEREPLLGEETIVIVEADVATSDGNAKTKVVFKNQWWIEGEQHLLNQVRENMPTVVRAHKNLNLEISNMRMKNISRKEAEEREIIAGVEVIYFAKKS